MNDSSTPDSDDLGMESSSGQPASNSNDRAASNAGSQPSPGDTQPVAVPESTSDNSTSEGGVPVDFADKTVSARLREAIKVKPPSDSELRPLPEIPEENSSGVVGTAIAWITTAVIAISVGFMLYRILTRGKYVPKVIPRKLTNVETMTVRPRAYSETLTLPARLKEERRAMVVPEVGGILLEWKVAEGAQVRKGDLVAVIDTDLMQSQLEEMISQRKAVDLSISSLQTAVLLAQEGLQAEKDAAAALDFDLKSALSNLNYVRAEYERTVALVASESIQEAAKDQMDNQLKQAEIAVQKIQDAQRRSQTAVRVAKLRLRQAKQAVVNALANRDQLDASIQTMKLRISKAEIHAPITGTMGKWMQQAGELVGPGQPIAQILDIRHLRATVDVPTMYYPLISGQPALIEEFIRKQFPGARPDISASVVYRGLPRLTGGWEGGAAFPAEVIWKPLAANPMSNTFPVELRFENPAGAFKPGNIFDARLRLLTWDRAIVIPTSAVQVSDEGPRVLVVKHQTVENLGKKREIAVATVRNIVPVSIRETEVFISKGLDGGEELIVRGGKGVVHGEAVKVLRKDGKDAIVGAKPESENASSDEKEAVESGRK